jgi:hypothetical protein
MYWLALGTVALAAGLIGVRMMETGGRFGISAAVLLFVVMMACAAIALGGHPYGPDVEGPLDLSARVGLGVLAGVLAGLFHGVLTEVVGSLTLSAILGVGVDVDLSAAEWGLRAMYGSVWGLALGVFYPVVPGGTFVSKGAAFSLLPTVFTLMIVYPVMMGVGLLGLRIGDLAWLFVLVGNALAGIVAAAVIQWGEKTELAPVSQPLVR